MIFEKNAFPFPMFLLSSSSNIVCVAFRVFRNIHSNPINNQCTTAFISLGNACERRSHCLTTAGTRGINGMLMCLRTHYERHYELLSGQKYIAGFCTYYNLKTFFRG